MNWTTLLLFIPACFALNLAPGPNNLLSVSLASRYGFLPACWAGVGRLAAFVMMIALTAVGLAVVLQTSVMAFYIIKIGGALYLFYMAWQLWHADTSVAPVVDSHTHSLWRMMRQEFWLAAGNPKAMLIFTAFLPQFIDARASSGLQFLILGSVFLLLEWLAIAVYAYVGAYLRRRFTEIRFRRRFNRGCAAMLGGAGVGLLLMRR